MATVKLIITMAMCIKEISLMDKDKGSVHMFLTKSTDMRVNGKITLFLEKESYLEMENSFSREIFRTD